MEFIETYSSLEVYKFARHLSRIIFDLTKQFPKEEMYSLTDQIRRSSRSTGAHIAEAWANRKYPRHFISKLTDADGERQETQHWIETALDCQYISTIVAEDFTAFYLLHINLPLTSYSYHLRLTTYQQTITVRFTAHVLLFSNIQP